MLNQANPNLEDTKANMKHVEPEAGNPYANTSADQNHKLFIIILGLAGLFVLICALIALAILYIFGRPYLEPKAEITLEPDYSQVSTIGPSDLETAAQILTARSRFLGYSGISFVVAENNQIIGQVPESVDIESLVERTLAIGLLELVDFGETPIAPGTRIATDFDYEYFPPVEGTKWHTVMTNSEYESVSVTQDQVGNYGISFTLTPSGTKALSDYTTANLDHYLGIVLDKVVLSAPRVVSPITDGRGIITGSFTQEEAENLAAYLRIQGPLPLPLIVKDILN